VSLAGAEFGEAHLPGIYGTDYIYPSANEAAYFKGKGMTMVRLPFRWERLQRTLNAQLDATELGRMKTFVNSVTAAGTTVLLDPHNYARYQGNLIGSGAVPIAAFADFWSRLATEFKGNSLVMFGLMNEPHDIQTETWAGAANAAIAAIRATGAANTVAVPGVAWTGAWSWSETYYGTSNAVAMLSVTDSGNNMLFEVHQYLDADSSGGAANPCVSASIGSERLANFTAWLRTNNRRGLLGEIGAPANATCNAALVDALSYVKNNADVWVGWVWWAAGPWWGNHTMSIEPIWSGDWATSGRALADKEQMSILAPYLR
jgi:endoglucanase